MNLAPLRQALLESALAEEMEVARREEDAATAQLEVAREEAETRVAQGKLEGERVAKREAARLHAAAVGRAREAQLHAQQAIVDELRANARETALRLREGPGYESLLDQLCVIARNQLGADAELERDPPAVGGVWVHAGARSVDYTLPTLVERTIDELGEAVEALWR